jgi:hypothetical protein
MIEAKIRPSIYSYNLLARCLRSCTFDKKAHIKKTQAKNPLLPTKDKLETKNTALQNGSANVKLLNTSDLL